MSLAMVNRRSVLFVIVCLGLAAPDVASADEDTRVTRITHFEDASSDRSPTVTAVPQYPELARRDRIEGEATVCYKIDKNGKIINPSVRKSSHKMFAKPSLKAIKQSSYEAIRPDQEISKVKTCRTFRFLLNPVAIEEIE
jgi:TonB family protein